MSLVVAMSSSYDREVKTQTDYKAALACSPAWTSREPALKSDVPMRQARRPLMILPIHCHHILELVL